MSKQEFVYVLHKDETFVQHKLDQGGWIETTTCGLKPPNDDFLPSKVHGQFTATAAHERRHDLECPCVEFNWYYEHERDDVQVCAQCFPHKKGWDFTDE